VRALSEVVELRVHGVSGTPPQELLDRDVVRRVAGTATVGFYRPTLREQRTDEPPDGPPGSGAPLEGYSWGGLTSGAPSRSLWLLLLPFTLVNLGPRLRPPATHPGWALRGLWTTSRVLGLTLTAGFVLTASGVGIDLFGWQCGSGGVRECGGPPAFMMEWVRHLDTGQRLAVGALVPLVMLGVLAAVSLTTAARYEAVAPKGADLLALDRPRRRRGAAGPVEDPPAYDPDDPDPELDHPALWYGKHLVRRLRHLHLQTGLATIVGTAVAPLGSPIANAALAGAVAVLVLSVVLACSSAVTGRRSDVDLVQHAPVTLWVLTSLTVLLGLVALLTIGDAVAGGDRPGLPGYAGTVRVLFAGQTVTLIAAAVCVTALRRRPAAAVSGWRPPPPRAPLAGYAAVVFTALALLVAGGFSAGAYILGAAWLRAGGLQPSFGTVRAAVGAFDIPQPMEVGAFSFAYVIAWAVLVTLVTLAWVAYRLRWPRRWTAGVALLDVEYPGVDRNPVRDAQILRIWWVARLADHAGRFVGALLFPVLGYGVVLALVSAAQRRSGAFADVVAWVTGSRGTVALGAYLVVYFLAAFVALGAVAFRVTATRRSVGILWDLASFWPRAAHPLAAPSYAERTVPDLMTRIRWYASADECGDYPTGALVLAGHSQGTVISDAVLAQLATADRLGIDERPVLPHVAYLSYGCVLRRLYARFFPAYLGPDRLDRLGAQLTADGGPCRWRNLWRRSDYLGGPVDCDWSAVMDPGLPASGRVDRRLVDPRYEPIPGDLTPPLAGRHSGFPTDPAFQRSVAELAAMLPAGSADETVPGRSMPLSGSAPLGGSVPPGGSAPPGGQGPTERHGRARSRPT
jgi:hypothetical protein